MPICVCPSCNCQLDAPEGMLGMQVRCATCGNVFVAEARGAPGEQIRGDLLPRQPGGDQFTREPGWLQGRDSPGGYLPAEDVERPSLRVAPRELPEQGRATFAVVMLVLTLILDLVLIQREYAHRQFIDEIELAQRVGGDMDALQRREIDLNATSAFIGLLSILILIATVVAICGWFYHAYRNLDDLNVSGLNHSPGWAMGYFFIPIVNLYRPCQVAQEIWRGSDPEVPPEDPEAWKKRPGSVLVGFWWTFWILANVVANGLLRASFKQDPTLEEMRNLTGIGMASKALSIIAGLLLIWVIVAIQERQRRKLALLVETAERRTERF